MFGNGRQASQTATTGEAVCAVDPRIAYLEERISKAAKRVADAQAALILERDIIAGLRRELVSLRQRAR